MSAPRATAGLTPCLTPHGRLILVSAADAPEIEAAVAQRLEQAFSRGAGHGLLRLGAAEIGRPLPPAFCYWRDLGGRYVTALCSRSDLETYPSGIPAPPTEELDTLASGAPAMPGAEYLTTEVLLNLWADLEAASRAEHAESGGSVAEFLKSLNPAWNVVGRVHFNLAENRSDEEAPFAFLATYSTRLSSQGKAQHTPLGQALREYAGAANKDGLLSLLLPVRRAAEKCPWLARMVQAAEIFHPLRWTPPEAFRMLSDIEALEQAGVVVRMPSNWRAGRPPRPLVTASIGGGAPSVMDTKALLDFRMGVTLEGEALSPQEIEVILAGTSGLALIRGQWVEVDRERLERMMERFGEAERIAGEDGLSFAEAMRMLAGADISGVDVDERDDVEWSRVVAGPWLADTLKALRSGEGLTGADPGRDLHGTLRPYQEVGVRWLHLLTKLGLGACLADDMGLGKTIQVLSLLLVLRAEGSEAGPPSLIVAPASLLANWASEIDRFTPSLTTMVAHSSAMPGKDLRSAPPEGLSEAGVVITSYGSALRMPWVADTAWRLVILDEAQAIKNPRAKQTRAIKQLRAQAHIALTGTPVENRLGDLWSIFDFLNPGLLGTAGEFTHYTKTLADKTGNPYGPLRQLVQPYILRRLKTDRSVISDLPDKTEVKAYCRLSRRQAALYGRAVDELVEKLAEVEGMQRRGLVLAFLMRFKQICNHPSQWLGDGAWAEKDSGKWARLRELCEVIAAKQEKALIFTQFREVTGPLVSFLAEVFGREGLVLHGQTPVKKRKDLVERFQEDESVPFFVLSLKAGGSGLNLTAASHVIHFDRWWNPAVEDQATDRAFRIGQTKNVLVHKFICQGTVEEKIDELIESKKQLSKELLEGGAEVRLSELKDEELLQLVALDLKATMKE